MLTIDLSRILAKYQKGWLALTPDNRSLVATGKTLAEVLVKAKKKDIYNPSVLKAAPVKHFFVG